MLQRPVESAQYTSLAFGRRCREAGVRPSMCTVGDCFDNAMCESFFATLECELLARSRIAGRALSAYPPSLGCVTAQKACTRGSRTSHTLVSRGHCSPAAYRASAVSWKPMCAAAASRHRSHRRDSAHSHVHCGFPPFRAMYSVCDGSSPNIARYSQLKRLQCQNPHLAATSFTCHSGHGKSRSRRAPFRRIRRR